jgi:hypothetical protein
LKIVIEGGRWQIIFPNRPDQGLGDRMARRRRSTEDRVAPPLQAYLAG